MCDVPKFAGMRVLLVWMGLTNDGWGMTPGSGIARICTVYFQIFRRCKNSMEGADSTIGRQTISSHDPLPKMPSDNSVNQQMEHKNADVIYRWLSLDEDQRLEYAYSLVDLREDRKRNNYAIKKC